METLLSYADPVAGIVGIGVLFMVPLMLFICMKTKKGRKFLELDD